MQKIHYCLLFFFSCSLVPMDREEIYRAAALALKPGQTTKWHNRKYYVIDRVEDIDTTTIIMQRYSHHLCGMPFELETVTRSFSLNSTNEHQVGEKITQSHAPSVAVYPPALIALCISYLYLTL